MAAVAVDKCTVSCRTLKKGISLAGVDGWIILGWISRRWDVDWIGLAQDRDRWRTLVNALMNLRVR